MITTKTLNEIAALYHEGLTDREIAERLGTNENIVSYWRGGKLKLPAHRTHGRYAVYDKKTSEFIVDGTAKKCAEYLGIAYSSFMSAASRCRHGKGGGKYEIYKAEV